MAQCRPYTLKGDKAVYYLYTINAGRDPVTGKRKQAKVRQDPHTGARWTSKRACEAAMRADQVSRRRRAHRDPAKDRMVDYLERWLTETAYTRSTSTTFSYRQGVKRLAPLFDGITLDQLGPLHIQAAYRRLLDTGYQCSSVRWTHTVLRIALRQAVAWHLLEADPSASVKPPTCPPRSRPVWTTAQASRFLATIADDPDEALWRVLIDSAARVGEVIALTWDDVDLARGELHIRRTMTRAADGRTVVGTTTKTRASVRTIAITPETVAALTAHAKAQQMRLDKAGSLWHDLGVIFDRGDGAHLDRSVIDRRLGRLCQRLNIPVLTPHGLRHSVTTIAVTNGVPLKVMADRLGHGSTRMTEQIYAHATAESDRRASETLSRLLQPKRGATGRIVTKPVTKRSRMRQK